MIRYFTFKYTSKIHSIFKSQFSTSDFIKINWKLKDGTVTTTDAKLDTLLLRAAQQHDIPLEGACEGTLKNN